MSLAVSALEKSTGDDTFPVQVRLQLSRQSQCTSYYCSMKITESEQNHTERSQSSLLSARTVLIPYFPKVCFFLHREDQDPIFL